MRNSSKSISMPTASSSSTKIMEKKSLRFHRFIGIRESHASNYLFRPLEDDQTRHLQLITFIQSLNINIKFNLLLKSIFSMVVLKRMIFQKELVENRANTTYKSLPRVEGLRFLYEQFRQDIFFFDNFYYHLLVDCMEELLGFEDQMNALPSLFNGNEFGESWQQISDKMKHALQVPARKDSQGHILDIYPRRKQHSDTASPRNKPSQSKKVNIKNARNDSMVGNSKVHLKIIRMITEDDNVESYRQCLTNRNNTQPSPNPKNNQQKEVKPHSPAFLRKNIKPEAIKSLQNGSNKESSQKIKQLRKLQNYGEDNKQSPLKIIKEENHNENRIKKSRSEAQCSPNGLIVPAKIDILIRKQQQNEPKIIEKASPAIILRKSIHLQEYSHLRESRNDRLPFLNLDNHLLELRKQRQSIHASNSHNKWLFIHRSLTKQHPIEECKKDRERQLHIRLQRELAELSKKSKLFANSRPSKLKLFK